MRDDPNGEIRVLHVDDDTGLLNLLSTALTRKADGITVESVENAREALDLIDDDWTRIDCLLSDYQMPGMDGLEFLSVVRDRSPEMPFLLYTSHGDDELVADAIARGVTDHVSKGASDAHYVKLGHRIERAVESARTRRDARERLAALEAAEEGICIIDADGRIKYANSRYLDIYGYERGELLGAEWETHEAETDATLVTKEVLPFVEEHGEWGEDETTVVEDESEVEADGDRHDGPDATDQATTVGRLPDAELVVTVTEFEES